MYLFFLFPLYPQWSLKLCCLADVKEIGQMFVCVDDVSSLVYSSMPEPLVFTGTAPCQLYF